MSQAENANEVQNSYMVILLSNVSQWTNPSATPDSLQISCEWTLGVPGEAQH